MYDLDVKVASGLLEGWMDSDGCHLGGAEEKLCITELSGTRPMFLQSRVMLVLQVLDLGIHPTASAMCAVIILNPNCTYIRIASFPDSTPQLFIALCIKVR